MLFHLLSKCQGFLRRLRRDESGATAIVTALVMTTMIGFIALGVEVGLWYGERRSIQTASDAAALGAAYKIYEDGKTASGITAAGKAEATRNGYTDGENNVTLTINHPPSTGPNAGNDYAVEAILDKQQSPLLASMFHKGDVTIGTRSVAVVRVTGPYCVLALSPTNDSSLKFGGTSDLNLENCGIVVNSGSNTAMALIGGSVVGATYADIVGGYTKSTNSTLDLDEGAPNTGEDAIDDPFADLNVPSGTGCDFTDKKVQKNDTATLNPGRYCGGITINAGAVVTMTSGNYVLVGGTFSVAGGATVTGDGVTIFLTGSGSSYAQVAINGGAIVNLHAPTTGDYKGIVFFQDRAAPVADSGAQNKFNGGSTMEINGAIYIPNQKLEFNGGNTSSGGCTRIVAYTIEFTGNSDVDSDCTGYGFDDETRRKPKLTE
jgi:hypothetical protein